MKSRWNSLVVGGCNVIGLTLLALSATAGGSAVRAAGDSPALESIAIESLTKMVSGLEQRVAAFEASVATFADSFTATRIAARELCVADDSGAQTCITKAQLDALLKGTMQPAQAAQATQATPEPQPHASEQGACPEKCVAPAETVAAPSEASPTTEPPAVKQTAATEPPAAAVKEAAVPDAAGAAAAAGEKASPDEAAAAVPPALPSVPDQQQAAAESAAPVAADTIIPTPRAKPAETVIATTAKPEALVPAETPAKDEEPAHADPATTGSAAPEPTAVQAETLPESERKE